jgi:hypothetical protein
MVAGFTWFQDGASYGGSDLANFNALNVPRQGFLHLFASSADFVMTSDQTARTIAVGPGNVLVGHVSGGATWAWTPGATIAVPTASTANPRRDLIIARLATAATDGVNGVAVEIIAGTPAASPAAPARPDNAVALGWVDVPQASTVFTTTAVRWTGQYRDQALMSAPGTVAIDWAGQLPTATTVPVGATVFDLGTGQRWIRTNAGTWFTTDPGPWLPVTLQSYTASDGTAVTVSGTLYIRESSIEWELSGRVDFAPNKAANQLVIIGTTPTAVTRPKVNTYGAVVQTWSASKGGIARLNLTNTGTLEFGSDLELVALYCNVQLSKSPFNT